MYRLFLRIVRGLDPVADVFKRHVESEGMKLVREVTEAAAAKKEKDAGAGPVCLLSIFTQNSSLLHDRLTSPPTMLSICVGSA